jgi:hypothetical protein
MAERTDLQALAYSIEAKVDRLEKNWQKAISTTEGGARRVEQRVGRMSRDIERRIGDVNIGKALGAVFDSSRLRVLDSGIARVGLFGSALQHLGPMGYIAAGGIIAVAGALAQAKAAMDFADNLSDTAGRLHVTTDALQEYRYAIRAAGGEEKGADEALEAFSVTLGKAQAGLPKAMKGFAMLGFSKEQVKSFKDVETGLDAVTAKIAGIGSNVQKDAVVSQLGLTGLKDLIEKPLDEIRQLKQEARDLGLVMDSALISRAATAHDEFESLVKVVKLQLMSAFVDLGPVLVGLLKLLGGMAKFAASIADDFRSIENKTTRGIEDQIAKAQAQNASFGPNPNPVQKGLIARNNSRIDKLQVELDDRQSAPGPAIPKGTDLIDVSGGKGSSGPTAAEKLQRGQEAVERAQRDALRVLMDATESGGQIAELKVKEVELERRREAERLRAEITEGKIDKKLAEQAIIIGEQTALARTALIRQQAADADIRQWFADQSRLSDIGHETASVYADLAKTAGERLALERRELALRQRQERDRFETLSEIDLRTGARSQSSVDGERGAIIDRQTAERAKLEGDAVDGLASQLTSFIERIRDKGLWRAAADSWTDRVREGLIKLAAQGLLRLATSEGNSNLGQLAKFGAEILGFAGGGRPAPGVPYLVGEHGPEIRVDGPGTIHPNGVLRGLGTQGLSAAPAIVHQHITLDNRGALIWEEEGARLLAVADRIASAKMAALGHHLSADIPARMAKRAANRI